MNRLIFDCRRDFRVFFIEFRILNGLFNSLLRIMGRMYFLKKGFSDSDNPFIIVSVGIFLLIISFM